MEVVAVPIGHAGTFLKSTLVEHLALALARWHPKPDTTQEPEPGQPDPEPESSSDEAVDPRAHKEMRGVVKQFADRIARLAADTLISIISLRNRLVHERERQQGSDRGAATRRARTERGADNPRPQEGRLPRNVVDIIK